MIPSARVSTRRSSPDEMLTVDLLYGDHDGGQLTISRFILTREDDSHWRAAVVRHWLLEGIDPRGR